MAQSNGKIGSGLGDSTEASMMAFGQLVTHLNSTQTYGQLHWSDWLPSNSQSDQQGTLTVTSDSPNGFVPDATVTAHVNDPDGVRWRSVKYQWLYGNGDGNWTPIEGATSASFKLTSEYLDKQIDVTATYVDRKGHLSTVVDPFIVSSPPPTTEPEPAPPAPDQLGTLTVNSSAGGFASGSIVTATVSDPDQVLVATYEWFVAENGQLHKIEDATTTTFTLGDAQAGKQIEVKVTYTDGAGHVATLTSPFAVDALPPINAPDPIPEPPADQPGSLVVNSNGGFASGKTVTAVVTDPDQVADASYEWLVMENGQWAEIAGATGSTLQLADAQAGKDIEVFVTYVDHAGHDAVLSDKFSVAALPPPPNAPGTLTISSPNGLNEGTTLTAALTDTDGLNVAAVAYTWQENVNGSWQDVGTGPTHQIDFDEGSHAIRVQANSIDLAGHDETLQSSSVTAIDVDRTGLLTVTSSSANGFVEGSTITTHVSDPDGVSGGPIAYHWSSMDSDGQWHDLNGATAATYKLTANDLGKQIDVTATYTDGQGHQATVSDPFTVEAPPPSTPPAGTDATILWSEEFNTLLDLKSSSNSDGLWAPLDFWQDIKSGGYEDFAGTSFNINPNNPTFAPYNPFSVENGYLQIVAAPTPDELVGPIQQEMQKQGQTGDVPDWIGGMLITNKDVVDFTYGYFEFSERVVDQHKGMFPAMWFYSADEGADAQGKSNAEIDLYEVFGAPNDWHTSMHGGATGSEIGSQAADTADWHTYGMLWEPDLLQFYRDDKLLYTVTGPEASYFNDLHLAIRVNFSMDSPWFPASATSDANTQSTMYMQIDYIRQYDQLPFVVGTG